MTCAECGAALDDGSKFCDSCGARQPLAAPATAVTLTPPRAPERIPAPTAGTDDEPPPADEPVAASVSDVKVLGSAEPNAHYLGQRLQYTEGAETFDAGEALTRATMSQFKFHLILLLFVWWFGGIIVIGLLYAIGGKAGVVVAVLLLMAFSIALLIAPFVRRQNFPVSEWKLMLDDKGRSADDVYDHIAASLVARDAPVQYRAVKLPDIWWRGYLQLRMGPYSGFITCFAFGKDLYIGWTLWWSMSYVEYRRANKQGGMFAIFVLPVTIVLDMLSGRADTYEFSYVHQYDEAKALRECVHAVTRQGVEAAAGLVPMTGKGTVGTVIPEGERAKFASAPSFAATQR